MSDRKNDPGEHAPDDAGDGAGGGAGGALDAAYRGTIYEAWTPGGTIEIRIGARCPAVDALLAAHAPDAPGWAYITAWNPGSRPLSREDNRARNQALERLAREACAACFTGVGRGEDGAWEPEESFLLVGIDRARALALGARFEQNAIVFGERGAAAELLWCTDADRP